jgi:glutamate-1-semialdehyde 2,1-aminomutase
MPNGVRFNQDYPDIRRSQELYARAGGLIPAYTQTLAKGPAQYVRGVAPIYLQRGKGAHVWDVDGNEFIDYQMAIGPLSLGYAYDRVDEAIRAQLADGITFSMMHPLEVEVAELVREVVPGAESVRYSKTGCDATSAAVRLARAWTGRDKVMCCGYHGWHDWYIAVTDRNRGIPRAVEELSYTFGYNDMDSVRAALDDDVACVILEPATFEAPRDGFLAELARACRERGALLVFDEMWTGFRFALGGAQEAFGVTADLACFSKAIANGMPISVLTGRRDVMTLLDQDVFFFTTFGGEALSLAAAAATIRELRDRRVPEQLARQGRKLREGYNAIAAEVGAGWTRAVGFDCRSLVTFEAPEGSGTNPLEMKSLVQQELFKRGVLWGGFHNLSFSHSDADVEHTLAAYREVLPLLRAAVESRSVRAELRGEPVVPVFRRTGGFNLKPKAAEAGKGTEGAGAGKAPAAAGAEKAAEAGASPRPAEPVGAGRA